MCVSCQPNEGSPGSEDPSRGSLLFRPLSVPQTHPVSSRGMCCCVFRVSRNLVLEPGKIITQGGNWDIQPVVIKHIRSNKLYRSLTRSQGVLFRQSHRCCWHVLLYLYSVYKRYVNKQHEHIQHMLLRWYWVRVLTQTLSFVMQTHDRAGMYLLAFKKLLKDWFSRCWVYFLCWERWAPAWDRV